MHRLEHAHLMSKRDRPLNFAVAHILIFSLFYVYFVVFISFFTMAETRYLKATETEDQIKISFRN